MSSATNEQMKTHAMSTDVALPLQQRLPRAVARGERPRLAAAEQRERASGRSDENGERLLSELEPTLAGDSPAITKLRQLILEVAPTRASVMIFGERGSCKEAVARAIHRLGKQSSGAFVPVNLAAIPRGSAERVLFGRELDASANGVIHSEQGYCEMADGGSLFLDELAALELQAQPTLLRFLQDGMLQRVGSVSPRSLSVRFISATNQDPTTLVAQGQVLEELFFRLYVVPIRMVPLRDRSEDIPALANHFLQQAASRHERPVASFSDEAMQLLLQHDWPGNVRQLENTIERLVIFARGPVVEAGDISADDSLISECATEQGAEPGASPNAIREGMLHEFEVLTPIERHERAAIVGALHQAEGHVVAAAKMLGMGQATVYRKIKQYAIPHERKRRRVLPR